VKTYQGGGGECRSDLGKNRANSLKNIKIRRGNLNPRLYAWGTKKTEISREKKTTKEIGESLSSVSTRAEKKNLKGRVA